MTNPSSTPMISERSFGSVSMIKLSEEGTSIMVSDFLIPNYGRLMLEDGSKSVALHSLIR
jgi:hypothetical protein